MFQKQTNLYLYSSDYFFIGNDPDLPDYPHSDYLEVLPLLSEIFDLYQGDSLWIRGGKIINSDKAQKYLTPNPAETETIYLYRLLRARFKPMLKKTIEKDYLGLLSQFQILNFPDIPVPASIESPDTSVLSNIDFKNNSLRNFFKECDRLALRDGGCFVYVDSPVIGTQVITEFDRQNNNLRPYFVIIERCNLINWKYININGQEILDKITIVEQIQKDKGKFGQEYILQYRNITRNEYTVYIKDDNDFTIVDQGINSLGYIPLVQYSLTSIDTFNADIPLKALGDICKDWYQLNSELREMINNTQPTLNLIEDHEYARDDDSSKKTVKIGSHAVIWNVNGKWIEASGTGIRPTQEQILKLENEADDLSIGFLTGSLTPKTATEIKIDTKQAESNLVSMMLAKQSAIENCFKYYFAFLNQENPISIEISSNLLRPIKDWNLKEVQDAVTSGFISRGFAMKLLLATGSFPDSFTEDDIDKELALTGEGLNNNQNVNQVLFED